MVAQRAVTPWSNDIVGSSPTSLTKVYCLAVSSDPPMREKLSRNCHLYAPVAQRRERGATNPGLVGVQIFSGVPYVGRQVLKAIKTIEASKLEHGRREPLASTTKQTNICAIQ